MIELFCGGLIVLAILFFVLFLSALRLGKATDKQMADLLCDRDSMNAMDWREK